MTKKPKMELKGIYGEIKKECGCIVRRYMGGKVVIIGCNKHPNRTRKFYKCGVCGERMTKANLKEHKWIHGN